MKTATTSYLYSLDKDEDNGDVQLSHLENGFHSIVGQISGWLEGLNASACYQPLLTLLVGLRLVVQSIWLLMQMLQVKAGTETEASSFLFDVDETPEALPCDMSAENVVEHNFIEQIEETSDVIDVPPTLTAPTPSPITAKAKFSSDDIIMKRLRDLRKVKHISPIFFRAAAREDYNTCSRLIQEGVDCDIPGPGRRYLTHIAAITGNMLLLSLTLNSERNWSTCSQGNRPMDWAAFFGHLEVVKYFVEKLGPPGFFDNEDLAIIERSLALARGHTHVADYLEGIRHRCLEDIRLRENKKLFRDAVSRNDVNGVQRLLADGISDRSALWVACDRGFATLVSILLSSTSDGFSYDIPRAVKFAALQGKKNLLVLLLDGIYDVDERKYAGANALQDSFNARQVKVCEHLVSCEKVDLHCAFQVAGDAQNLQFLQWLIEKANKDEFYGAPINYAFQAAVSSSSTLPLIEFLVENDADVDSECKVWGTALQHAVGTNRFDLVDYLVSEGMADVNARGLLGGSSPLMAAISGGNITIFHYLINIHCRDPDFPICLNKHYGDFGNILQTASYLGRQEILEEILSIGFDINARLEPHGSALIMAIQGGKLDIAELLISQGANVNLSTPKYGTALHLAAAAGIGNIVKSLIRAGADVNAEGGGFGTPLQAAAAKGHQLIVLYLLDSGADVNRQGGGNGNALKAAQDGGHDLLAEFLLFSGAYVT